MTTFGKILAFLNVFAAVGILTWALSLYVNRVDYLDRRTETETVKGQITKLREEIDQSAKAVAESQSAYGAKLAEIARTEGIRDYRQTRFRQRLDQARKGQFRVQVPVAGAADNVFTDVDKEGPVVVGPDNQPLRGIEATQADLDAEVRTALILVRGAQPLPEAEWQKMPEIVRQPAFPDLVSRMGIAELRRVHGVLSDLIARTDEAAQRQRVIATNLRDEARFLSDYRVNWTAELQSLERRQRQLEGRLQGFDARPEGK